MVSNGNHPLDHIDEITLEEYALGQLLPDQEEAVRQHLIICAPCRTKVTEIQDFVRKVEAELHHQIDPAEPGPRLSFDHIVPEWRKPPRRLTLTYRLQQYLPDVSTAFLLVLFGLAFALLIPSAGTTGLRSLELIKTYEGPPAVIAAATEEGLVVLDLSSGRARVLTHLTYITNPENIQFSPNGHWLAFGQGRTLHIIQTREAGSHSRIEVHDAADWSWSPDSTTLAYTDGTGQLVLFETISQTVRVLVPAEESAWGAPVWSQEGQDIAYATAVPLPSTGESIQQQGIWRVSPSTGYRVELARAAISADILLLPASWSSDGAAILAWDLSASAVGNHPALYRIDVAAHLIEPLEGYSQAQGTRLAWPMSSQNILFTAQENRLVALQLASQTTQTVPDQLPWPHMLDWAPNGAWAAYTVPGMSEGEGLYLFTLQEGSLRSIKLPKGATEKAVFWAGPEHLFVIRQPTDTNVAELWVVSLTTGRPPERILTNARLPETGPYIGWQWQDVLAMQVLKP